MGVHKKSIEDDRILIGMFKEMVIILGCLEDVKRTVIQLKPAKIL